MRPRSTVLLGALLSLALGLVTTVISGQLTGRFENRADTVTMERSHLHSGGYSIGGGHHWPKRSQNRVLFPLALEGLVALGWPPVRSYSELRLLTAWLAFATIYGVARRLAPDDPSTAAGAAIVAALATIASFNFPYEIASDFPDLAFTAVGVLVVYERRIWAALLVSCLMSANRESSLFIGLMWVGLGGRAQLWRGLGLITTAWLVVSVLRYITAGTDGLVGPTLPLRDTFEATADFMRAPRMAGWPVLGASMAGVLLGWLVPRWPRMSAAGRRLVWTAGVVVLITAVMARLDELRVLLPAVAMLALAGALEQNAPRAAHE